MCFIILFGDRFKMCQSILYIGGSYVNNGKLKNRLRNTADKVARHSKPYLITVYYNML